MLEIIHKKIMERPRWRSIAVLWASLFTALAVSAWMLALQDKPPLGGLVLLFQGAFGSWWALQDCLLKAIPLFLCSLGVSVAFRLQVWNIGAEGQFAMGAMGAAAVALYLPDLPAGPMLLLMLVASMITGSLWGLIPAVLRLRLRANEIIVTLMLNYVAILFLDYLVYGPWKDPVSFGFPMTPLFPDAAIIGPIGDSRIHWGLVFCLVCAGGIWLVLGYTRLGFQLQASGENPRAARYAHMPVDRLVLLVMAVSGALAGWAGFVECSATVNRLQPSIMVGYGYTAIVVAWLAKLNVLRIALAAFLLAGLRVGVETLQLELKVPAAFGNILEGIILLTILAGDHFNHYRLHLRWRHGT